MPADAYTFQKAPAEPITAPEDLKIVNVVPGDFNYDGRLDVLLMSKTNPGSWWDDNVLHIHLYTGQGESSYSKQNMF